MASIIVDEVMTDNAEDLERKVDLLTEEVKALRNDLETRNK
jgi:hypothetical protein